MSGNHLLEARTILYQSVEQAIALFKEKNAGRYLGVLWYLLDPLFMFLIILALRGLVGKGIPNYPLYLLVGLLMYNFFMKTTTYAVNIFEFHRFHIRSVLIDPIIFPLSVLFLGLISHFFEILILACFLLYYGVSLLNLAYYAIILAFYSLFILGVSLIVSIIGVNLSDIENIWRFFCRLLLFATPIFYSSDLRMPVNLNIINPLYYFITLSRRILIQDQMPELSLVFATVFFSILSLSLGLFIFNAYRYKILEKL
ncbi:ABC transporter permease [Candidatus Altiarchaeota archaeon]